MTNYPSPQPLPNAQPKSNAKWWILGGCGCVFLLVALVAVVFTMLYFVGRHAAGRHRGMMNDQPSVSETADDGSTPTATAVDRVNGYTGGEMLRGTFKAADGSWFTFKTDGTYERSNGESGTYYLDGKTIDLSPSAGNPGAVMISASDYKSQTPQVIEIDAKPYRLVSGDRT